MRVRSRIAVPFVAFTICFGALAASAQRDANQPGTSQPRYSNNPDAYADSPRDSVPADLTIPAGTLVPVRVNEWLSSDRNRPGDTFSATLDQPLVVDGWVVARRGQSVIGRVAIAEKAPRGGGESRLGVELADLIVVDGQQLPVRTELVRSAAPPARGRNAAAVGTTAVIGAAIGAIAGGGEGAAIGAVAGGAAGMAGVMATRGRPTEIPPETVLTFRLDTPLTISTERSRVAFQPVTQRDYNRDRDADAYATPRRRYSGGVPPVYAPAPYYYSSYCSGWDWYCGPAPIYLGIYGGGYRFAPGFGRGFGPRFGGRRF
jgi:hypothetical protein